ncbi:MAG: hypothetical protein OEX08_00725 [Candidatus Nomurabacteria bacterium]|nr:hypothetical protein [Candidatus Nomurabacteria bacterium]
MKKITSYLRNSIDYSSIIRNTTVGSIIVAFLIVGQPTVAAGLAISASPLAMFIPINPTATSAVSDTRAQQVEAYFAQWDLPAGEYAESFIVYADKYDLDWRLVASLAMLESTGFKNACGNNGFGWGSCGISFPSHDEAIRTVTLNLAGHNPNTARYYADKNIHEILEAYNPPETVGITPNYHKKVIRVMDEIATIDISGESVQLATRK